MSINLILMLGAFVVGLLVGYGFGINTPRAKRTKHRVGGPFED